MPSDVFECYHSLALFLWRRAKFWQALNFRYRKYNTYFEATNNWILAGSEFQIQKIQYLFWGNKQLKIIQNIYSYIIKGLLLWYWSILGYERLPIISELCIILTSITLTLYYNPLIHNKAYFSCEILSLSRRFKWYILSHIFMEKMITKMTCSTGWICLRKRCRLRFYICLLSCPHFSHVAR